MKNDAESVAWRERMRGLKYDPKTETITPLSENDEHPVRYEEIPVDPTIAASLNAAKYLESIDKSVATIKHVLVFFLVLTIIGIVIGLIAVVAR